MKAYGDYVFDFYGTLVDIKTDEDQPEVWAALADSYGQVGVCYDGAELKEAYQALVEQTLLESSQDWAYPEFDVKRIFTQLYKDKIEEPSLSEADLDLWLGELARTFRQLSRDYLRLYPETQAILTMLKEKGARLFLLSNAQVAYTEAEIDEVGLRGYFDDIYLSSDYGMRKPQPEFLELVLKDHVLLTQETVIVGNDLTSDMAVAESVGIDGILLNTFPYSPVDLADFHGPVIGDIGELLEYTKE